LRLKRGKHLLSMPNSPCTVQAVTRCIMLVRHNLHLVWKDKWRIFVTRRQDKTKTNTGKGNIRMIKIARREGWKERKKREL